MPTVELIPDSAVRQASIAVPSASTWAGSATVAHVPQMIPHEELFFWTAEWQELERAAERDLAGGRHRVFSDFQDAADWLLSETD